MLVPALNPKGVAEAIAYAATHGIVVAQNGTSLQGSALSHAPMTYRPSPMPAACYHEARRITPLINGMVARIASDRAYLRSVLAETAAADAGFTGRLLALLADAPREPAVELTICRYDYFVHEEGGEKSLRMVEMNCIAASFACLGSKTSDMHRYLATHPVSRTDFDLASMPVNDAMGGLASGIAAAHEQYVKRFVKGAQARVVALMIVQPGERNAYDQDLLRMTLWEKHTVEMIRMSMAEVDEFASLDEDGGLRVLSPYFGSESIAVSVIYFRAGYAPDDYPSECQWNARALMEKSNAAKCPSIAMQLVGTKKIQQHLDLEGEVERFVDSKADADAIRATFARQYSLSSADNGEKTASMAVQRPDEFVLKPQREGGGNNLYSQDLKKALETMSSEERSAFVLMERIRPVVERNVIIRAGKVSEMDVVSEFGVYGVHVRASGQDLINGMGGTLLRSKSASQDDGGVAAGVAVLDSPRLV